jgi:hypothetical protein
VTRHHLRRSNARKLLARSGQVRGVGEPGAMRGLREVRTAEQALAKSAAQLQPAAE